MDCGYKNVYIMYLIFVFFVKRKEERKKTMWTTINGINNKSYHASILYDVKVSFHSSLRFSVFCYLICLQIKKKKNKKLNSSNNMHNNIKCMLKNNWKASFFFLFYFFLFSNWYHYFCKNSDKRQKNIVYDCWLRQETM